jgi:hypothetical protein
MKNQQISWWRLFLIKNTLRTIFPNEARLVHKLVSKEEYTTNNKIGGIKLKYLVTEEIPVCQKIGKIKIFLRPIVKDVNTIVYFKPLKSIWTKNEKEISYALAGKKKDPLMAIWLRLKKDFLDIVKEQYSIEVDEQLERNKYSELYQNLNKGNKKFIIIKSK